MGCKKFVNQTNTHLQTHIRSKAENSANVIVVTHASDQMNERKVSRIEVLECLRKGMISRKPEVDDKDSLRCRMEHYIAGRNCMAIVALCDEAADLIIVTVMTALDRK